MGTTELEDEQSYFDQAAEWRERSRETLQKAGVAAVNPGQGKALHEKANAVAEQLGDPGSAVAIGRFDTDDGETLYVGRHAIWGAQADVLVLNWKTPGAQPFYGASATDTQGIARKREFSCEGNTILDFQDLIFKQLQQDISELEESAAQPLTSDALLEDLERHRTGEMQDIVRTIQAAQFDLIKEDLDQLLVIQGGPGTGKTALALHRVSWLLYNYREELRPDKVLVVGPSRTFIRYVRQVLPDLGDRDVVQADLASLGPTVAVKGVDTAEVTRLKGDLRMKGLIGSALRDRIRVPADPVKVGTGGLFVSLAPEDNEAEVEKLSGVPYSEGASQLAGALRRLLERRAAAKGQSFKGASFAKAADTLAGRVWPQISAAALVRELYGSKDRLLSAAGDAFGAHEVQLLYRRAAERMSEENWTASDIPVLDFAEHRINGTGALYRHIVVDEAQDLSPMQLDMIDRRSESGSMTILGDIAQSCGPWSRDSWADVIGSLRSSLPVEKRELEYGYRVPRQIFDFAAQLLPHIAPDETPPRVVRDGSDVRVVEVPAGSAPDGARTEAAEHAARGLSVGIICPEAFWGEVLADFSRNGVNVTESHRDGLTGSINLVRPQEAKGLEFEAVVVIEPEAIVAEDGDGLRLLYVALTRSTRELSVITSGRALPLPGSVEKPAANEAVGDVEPPSGRPSRNSIQRSKGESGRAPRAVRLLAADLATEIRDAVRPEHWEAVLSEIEHQLDLGDG